MGHVCYTKYLLHIVLAPGLDLAQELDRANPTSVLLDELE
jgi:hypothetical protein